MDGNCIYLKKTFVVGAKEHVLQAALGARWKDGLVISPEVNSQFSEIDAYLVKTIHPIRLLLGAEGEYGPGGVLKNIPDGDGRKFRVESGGGFELSQPFVKTESLPDGGAKIYAEISDSNQAEWAAAAIIKEVSQTTPELKLCQKQLANDIIDKGEKRRAMASSPLHFQLVLGGIAALRAITKSAFNLLGVNAPHIAVRSCFDPVRSFILNGVGNMEDFIRWGTEQALIEPRLGLADHFLAVWSDKTGVWAYCQLYGVLVHPIRLTREIIDEEFSFSYLVDPLREAVPAEQRNVPFDTSTLQDFNSSYKKPVPVTQTAAISRIEAILSVARQRMAEAEVRRIAKEFLANHTEPYSPDIVSQLHKIIAEYIATLISPMPDEGS